MLRLPGTPGINRDVGVYRESRISRGDELFPDRRGTILFAYVHYMATLEFAYLHVGIYKLKTILNIPS